VLFSKLMSMLSNDETVDSHAMLCLSTLVSSVTNSDFFTFLWSPELELSPVSLFFADTCLTTFLTVGLCSESVGIWRLNLASPSVSTNCTQGLLIEVQISLYN
jgi:hypothetical protein